MTEIPGAEVDSDVFEFAKAFFRKVLEVQEAVHVD
jgi:hypothetical protein